MSNQSQAKADLEKIIFPTLPKNAEPGVWYRIQAEGAITSDGNPSHGEINFGTENKVLLLLNGGGASWNEYMAARPNDLSGADSEGFYFGNMTSVADALAARGISDKSREDNPFRNWTIICFPYSTGDFHCGTGDFPYEDTSGAQRILYHHGYTNFRLIMRQIQDRLGTPDHLVVSGFSAGGFGAALLTDTVANMFPDCAKITCLADSGFMLYDGVREAAEKVWEAPAEIVSMIHSSNIALDAMQAAKARHGERVQILFSCSVRDVALSRWVNFIEHGQRVLSLDALKQFQKNLGRMCDQLLETIPDAAVYLFDTPASAASDAETDPYYPTVHTIIHYPLAYSVRVEGKSLIEWVWDALNGRRQNIGLELLQTPIPR